MGKRYHRHITNRKQSVNEQMDRSVSPVFKEMQMKWPFLMTVSLCKSSFTCPGFSHIEFKSQHHHLEDVWPWAYDLALWTPHVLNGVHITYLLCRVIERVQPDSICNVFSTLHSSINGSYCFLIISWHRAGYFHVFLHLNPLITLRGKHYYFI